jgi:hypothetical protein
MKKQTSKKAPKPPLNKGDVISRFKSNSKKVVITETELRGLIFWASTGIEIMNGGSYYSTVEFINDNYNLMQNDKAKYKKLSFGTRLKNGL